MALSLLPVTALAADDPPEQDPADEYTAVLGMDEILTLKVGETKKLDVWARPMTGDELISGGTFTYEIFTNEVPDSDENYNAACISIDENGYVTANKVTRGCAWVNVSWTHENYTAQLYQAQVFVISDANVDITFSATDMLSAKKYTLPYTPNGYKVSDLVNQASATSLADPQSSIQYGAEWNLSMMAAWLWENSLGADHSFKDQVFKDVGKYTVTATYNAEDGYGTKSISFEIVKEEQPAIAFEDPDGNGSTITTATTEFGGSLLLRIKGGAEGDADRVLSFSATSGNVVEDGGSYIFYPDRVGTSTITATLESPNYETKTATLAVTVEKGIAAPQKTSAEIPVSYQTAGQSQSYNFGGMFNNLDLGSDVSYEIVASGANETENDPFFGDKPVLQSDSLSVAPGSTVLNYTVLPSLTAENNGDQSHVYITVTSTNYEPFVCKLLFTVSDKGIQDAPTADDFSLTIERATGDDPRCYIATINSGLEGVEYSFDGGATWSSSSQLTIKSDDSVAATIRYTATDTAEASPAAPIQTATAPSAKAPAPTVNPNGGSFSGSLTITLSCEADTATSIIYTLDGSDPKTSSTAQKCQSGDSITITATTTLRAYTPAGGSNNDWDDSDELRVTFTKTTSSGGNSTTTPGGETPEPPSGGDPGGSDQPSADVESKVDGDQASASVDANTVDQLTDQATSSGSGSVTVAVKAPSDVSQVAVSLPASAVADLADKTDAALNIETPVASVTIPNDSLAELSTGSQALSVTAAKNENNTVSITVAKDGETVDKVSGGLKATIPLEESTPGTVAVLVNPDGTETIIKKSIASDGSVSLPLDGSATVKFVDNSQPFQDTQDHWAKSSIDFVSSHDLFNGTGNGNFSADRAMNRAMLVTVLHRLEDTPAGGNVSFDDVAEGQYYSVAVAWASSSGIVTGTGDGFSPDGDVTREQIAVFLFRYAKVIGVNTSGQGSVDRFDDSGSVSTWAEDAMSWAVGTGVISGTSGNRLDPNGSATRGEVATMLMRFVGYLNK